MLYDERMEDNLGSDTYDAQPFLFKNGKNWYI